MIVSRLWRSKSIKLQLLLPIVDKRNRFDDTSRELYEERSTSETRYKQSSSLIVLVKAKYLIDEHSSFSQLLRKLPVCISARVRVNLDWHGYLLRLPLLPHSCHDRIGQ